MFQRLLSGGISAGLVAGILASVLHFAFVQDLILKAETYESPEAGSHDSQPHHETTEGATADTAAPAAENAIETASETHGASQDEAATATAEPSTLSRNALTVLFTTVIYTAYALLLTAGLALASQMGRTIDRTTGLLWGLGGFAAFQLSPAMGMAPGLPGSMAGELADRQVWWWLTALSTAAGLGLIAYGRGSAIRLLAGVALLALPHIWGAPQPEALGGSAPPELAAGFAARILGVGLITWAGLGMTAGWLWERTTRSNPA